MRESIYSGSNENTHEETLNQPMASFASMMTPAMFRSAPTSSVAVANAAAAQHYRLESAAFTHALVALSAKLSTIDGSASQSEYAAFHALFVAGSTTDAAMARSLFVQRATDTGSALQYARQVAAMTPGQSELHMDLLQRLLQIAQADGALNAAELELLRAVADVFGVAKEKFRALMAQSFVPAAASPYAVLGISPRATDKELRDHYVARVQKLHPDRYQAAGASAETIAMLSDQMAALNAAYRSVQQARAKKSAKAATVASWWGRK